MQAPGVFSRAASLHLRLQSHASEQEHQQLPANALRRIWKLLRRKKP
jgi:hypothetical protein